MSCYEFAGLIVFCVKLLMMNVKGCEKVLRLENLTVEVNDKVILRNINFHIKPGEVHVLFGPNGTGKSTLVGAIMGFPRYKIIEGKVFFKDKDVTNIPIYERARMGMGVMVQRPPTIRGLTIREITAICARGTAEIEKLANLVKMNDFLNRAVNDGFSGGEIKRSELLQLMAQNPDLLLLDEPESGVDIENIAVVGAAADYILERGPNGMQREPLKKRRAKRKKSGLIITHTGHILNYVPADIAHVLYEGTLSCSGNPQEMLDCIRLKGYGNCVSCMQEG